MDKPLHKLPCNAMEHSQIQRQSGRDSQNGHLGELLYRAARWPGARSLDLVLAGEPEGAPLELAQRHVVLPQLPWVPAAAIFAHCFVAL